MGQVIEISGYQTCKSAELAEYTALECPQCEALCAPVKVDEQGAVHHRCSGNGHRPITWRIAEDGTMLRGSKGVRPYII